MGLDSSELERGSTSDNMYSLQCHKPIVVVHHNHELSIIVPADRW